MTGKLGPTSINSAISTAAWDFDTIFCIELSSLRLPCW